MKERLPTCGGEVGWHSSVSPLSPGFNHHAAVEHTEAEAGVALGTMALAVAATAAALPARSATITTLGADTVLPLLGTWMATDSPQERRTTGHRGWGI